MSDFRMHPMGLGTLVDEVVIGPGSFCCCRTGIAQYVLQFHGDDGRELTLKLWTTRIGAIGIDIEDDAPFVRSVFVDGGLQSLNADRCRLHVEHLDRGFYCLGLEDGRGAVFRCLWRSAGYLKCVVIHHRTQG
jgi:hypothetical protein